MASLSALIGCREVSRNTLDSDIVVHFMCKVSQTVAFYNVATSLHTVYSRPS